MQIKNVMGKLHDFVECVEEKERLAAKTVCQILVHRVRHVANEELLYSPSLVLNTLQAIVKSCKLAEFPFLLKDEDKLDAILVGEIFAISKFHTGVLRFTNDEDAWNWVSKKVDLKFSERAISIMQTRYGNKFLSLRGNLRRVSATSIIKAFFAQVEADGYPRNLIQDVLYYTCGMAKMGTVSNSWIEHFLPQFCRNCGREDIKLPSAVVRAIWEYYGLMFAPIESQWFDELFEQLKTTCDTLKYYRLSSIVKLATGYGDAVRTMIQQAMTMCSDFDWKHFGNSTDRRLRNIATEIDTFRDQLTAIVENPYLMFRPEHQGAGEKMKNLGYLAKQLLTFRGIFDVNSYGDPDEITNAVIPHGIVMDKLVQKYYEMQKF